MSEAPLLDARDLQFLNDNFVEIFAAHARFRASMQAGRDLLHFIAAQESVLDDTEQAQDDWVTSTLNTVPAERQSRAAVAITDLLSDLVAPALTAEGLTLLTRTRALLQRAVAEIEAGRKPDPATVDELLAFDPSALAGFVTDRDQPRPDAQKAIAQFTNLVNAFGDVRSVAQSTPGWRDRSAGCHVRGRYAARSSLMR